MILKGMRISMRNKKEIYLVAVLKKKSYKKRAGFILIVKYLWKVREKI